MSQVLALDKRLFDPRRTPTPTPAEQEEGILPLTDSIPINPQVSTRHLICKFGVQPCAVFWGFLLLCLKVVLIIVFRIQVVCDCCQKLLAVVTYCLAYCKVLPGSSFWTSNSKVHMELSGS